MPIISQSSNRAAKVLRTIAIAITSIWVIYSLFFGLLTGVKKGLGIKGVLVDIVTGLIYLACAAIAWQWGLIGGIILIVLVLLCAYIFIFTLGWGVFGDSEVMVRAFIYILANGLPPLLAGVLFIISWWKANPSKPMQRERHEVMGATLSKNEGPKRPIVELPKILKCPNCGVEYNPEDYRHDILEWVCPQCKKALPRE